MLGMKNHFDISGSIEIREVDIAGVACTYKILERRNNEISGTFSDYLASCEALPHTSSFCLYFHSKK